MNNFDIFVSDYLQWSAQQKVRDNLKLQQTLQTLHYKQQRKEAIAYRQKLETFKQIKIEFL